MRDYRTVAVIWWTGYSIKDPHVCFQAEKVGRKVPLFFLKMLSVLSIITVAVPLAHAASKPVSGQTWAINNFKALVAFGDSYTDESRLSYFLSHNCEAPPVGWVGPVVCYV